MKARAFRRGSVIRAYSPERTTRLTGGSDCYVCVQFIYAGEPELQHSVRFLFEYRSADVLVLVCFVGDVPGSYLKPRMVGNEKRGCGSDCT